MKLTIEQAQALYKQAMCSITMVDKTRVKKDIQTWKNPYIKQRLRSIVMTKKKLYTFYADFGRMGSLEGLFISTEEEINVALNKTADFGEVLGKHSDISIILTSTNFTMLSDDQEKIAWLEEIMKSTVISGYNPLDYILCEHCGENREYCDCALKGKDSAWVCPTCREGIDQHCFTCGVCFKDRECWMGCDCR